eukprot:2379247-Pyramimonas_sp.AAC.1
MCNAACPVSAFCYPRSPAHSMQHRRHKCHQSYSPTTIANVNSLVIGRVPKSRSSVGTWVRSDRARDGHTASVKNRWDN